MNEVAKLRRRWSFSLKSLLIVVTVAALCSPAIRPIMNWLTTNIVFSVLSAIFTATLIAAMAFVTIQFVSEYLEDRRFTRELRARQHLSDDAFYECYYQASSLPRDQVVQLRHAYADFFGIDSSKLLPFDRPSDVDEVDTGPLVRTVEH